MTSSHTVNVRYTKMHGAGNDFVCLDAVADPDLADREDLDTLAVAVCDRVSGAPAGLRVGADGLIVIGRAGPDQGPAAVTMRMFNADGSESMMCGNGLRCVVKYVVDRGHVDPDPGEVVVRSGVGDHVAAFRRAPGGEVVAVTVDMGVPQLSLERIPVDPGSVEADGPRHRFTVDGETLAAIFVSMGNPHAVVHVDDVNAIDLERIGPRIEHYRGFPQRMNTHFVEVLGAGEARMRTWERGSGATRACGSGACAVCVAGVLGGRTGPTLLAHLPGGDLELRWDRPGPVFMTGPAVEEFSASWPASRPASRTAS